MDLRLPGMSGVEICKQLRAAQVRTPIIVLSAVGDEIDKVLLLEIGADDYVVKPFGTARIAGAHPRRAAARLSAKPSKVIHFGDIEVDLERRVVTRKGEGAQVHARRIQPARLFPAEPGPAADPRHDSELRLGLRILSRTRAPWTRTW